MSNLSLLMHRAVNRFTADARFHADVAADEPPLTVPPPPDPVAQAHAAGYAEGFASAQAQALTAADSRREMLERLGFGFARLDAELTETLRQRLVDSVAALCEATLAPLALDKPALVRRVERAAAMFVRADDDRVIRLNPDDWAAVRDLLPEAWHFLPDPALPTGALRVETAAGGVEDGPEQWRRAIAEALALC